MSIYAYVCKSWWTWLYISVKLLILYYLFYYSSWAKTSDEFTNTVKPNSQLRHSRHLLFHPQLPKHHHPSN